MQFSFAMDPKLMKEVNDASSPLWTPHTNATHGRNESVAWNELVEVIEATVEQDPKNPEWGLITLKFQCSPDSATEDGSPNPNVGRTHMEWYRFAPAAIHNSGHEDRKMTVFTLAALKNLGRAAALLAEGDDGGDFSSLYKSDEGEQAPIVGARVNARVRLYNDRQSVRRMELGRFTPVEG